MRRSLPIQNHYPIIARLSKTQDGHAKTRSGQTLLTAHLSPARSGSDPRNSTSDVVASSPQSPCAIISLSNNMAPFSLSLGIHLQRHLRLHPISLMSLIQE